MRNITDISEKIIGSVLQPAKWQSVLTDIAEIFGCYGVNIMAPTGAVSLECVLHTDSLSAALEGYMNEEWHLRDYRANFQSKIIRQAVAFESQIASQAEMRQIEYYKFLAKYKIGYSAITHFSCGDAPLFLCLQRNLQQGPIDPVETQKIMRIRKHFQSAADLINLLRTSELNGHLNAFQRADIACLIYDARGQIINANDAAQHLLTGDVKIANGQLNAASVAETQAVKKLVREALDAGLHNDNQLSIALTRQDKRPLLARIEILPLSIRDIFTRACAIMYLEAPERSSPRSPDILRKLFKLTPTEIKITNMLAAGLDTDDISNDLQISRETVRTHFRAIFRKTETRGQAPLVAMLNGLKIN